MSPTIYLIHASPPVRAVLITAKAIGLDLVEKEVDFFHDEHLKPEFLKLNPQHTIPTFVDDDGFAIWDSHAIMIYLVSKYAKDDALYPKDLKRRALIDQRLYFESGVVFSHLRRIAKSILVQGKTTIDQKDRDGILESYEFLEAFLEGKEWVAGDDVTIADYSLVSSISTTNCIIRIDPEKYPKVTAWLGRCQSLPECHVNKKGLDEASHMLNIRLSKMY